MTDRLEALADAIAQVNSWGDPRSRAYQLRNPLLLKAFSLARIQSQDPEGYREFHSLVAGYRAGLFDLRVKLSGESRADVGNGSLVCLLRACGLWHPADVKKVVQFLEDALACTDGTIRAGMAADWFLQTSANAAVAPMEGERISSHAG